MFDDIKSIYNEAFGEDEAFLENLINNAASCLKSLTVDGKCVAFFFLLPIDILRDGERSCAFYLFAAATDKCERNKGYMSKLLRRELALSNIPIILKPASDVLIDYYSRFGFKTFKANFDDNTEFFIMPKDEFSALSPEPENKSGEYTAMLYGDIGFDLNNISFKFPLEE